MLALRNAVCNDRWREMWQKALRQHHREQALQRAARTQQQAQPFLAVDNSTSQQPSSQPASQELSVLRPSATLPSSSGSCLHSTTELARLNRSSPAEQVGEAENLASLVALPSLSQEAEGDAIALLAVGSGPTTTDKPMPVSPLLERRLLLPPQGRQDETRASVAGLLSSKDARANATALIAAGVVPTTEDKPVLSSQLGT
jgi:hypothetical protein